MYHPQHHESQPIQQYPQEQQPPPANNGYASNAAGDTTAAAASSLDHALLESLFYNEMQMLENSPVQAAASSPPCLPTEHDTPHTILEKEILRDFGVDSETAMYPPATNPPAATTATTIQYNNHPPPPPPPPNNNADYTTGLPTAPAEQQQQQQMMQQQQSHPQPPHSSPLHHQPPSSSQYSSNTAATTSASYNTVPSSVTSNGGGAPPSSQLGMVYVDPQATATAAAAAAAMLSPAPGTKLQSTNTTTTTTTTTAISPLVSSGRTTHPEKVGNVPQDRARQLVDQFATLASRLGIDLPDSVLQSLTSAAAKNDPTLLLHPPTSADAVPKPTPVENGVTSNPETTTNDGSSAGSATELSTMAPTVMELRKTAEEAIAAVTQSSKDSTTSSAGYVENNASVSVHNSTVANSNSEKDKDGNSKPTYSKRRKKPRLSDCEEKLAQLKAENEQLKRHLQNVSNKAHKFDKEKASASKQIAQLMNDPNVDPKVMELSVRKFSDMYSDYGVNRQQELSFHLDQLQRLVNPTNFTKMGLWTLGQSNQGSKKNPIAGILVKELDITPQQGRKILDQSEKIRQLCDNLKEAHALLNKLKLLCEKKTRTFQDRMNKCTEILTSKQVVKLIIWINDHSQLLDNVCPGWGTEHIHSKNK